MEHYKERMATYGLYVLAMSEGRRDGSGEQDVGDRFTFIWQGNGDDGSKGGVGFLFSPEAAKAWRKSGSVSKSSDIGRILRLSFALGAKLERRIGRIKRSNKFRAWRETCCFS